MICVCLLVRSAVGFAQVFQLVFALMPLVSDKQSNAMQCNASVVMNLNSNGTLESNTNKRRQEEFALRGRSFLTGKRISTKLTRIRYRFDYWEQLWYIREQISSRF
jgi:hypothetical protein